MLLLSMGEAAPAASHTTASTKRLPTDVTNVLLLGNDGETGLAMARGRRKVLPSRAQEHVISELIYLNLSSPSEPAQQIQSRSHYETQVSPRVVESVLRHFQNAGYVESSGGSNKMYRLRPLRLRKSRSTSDNDELRRRRPPPKEEKIERALYVVRCGSRESTTSGEQSLESREQLRGRKRKRSREPSFEPDPNDADTMSPKVNKKCHRESTTSTSVEHSLELREQPRGRKRKRSREPSYERGPNDAEVTEERGHQRDNDAEDDAMSDDSLTSAERRWRMRHPVLMWTSDRRKPKRSHSNSSVSSAIRRWSMRRHLIHWSPTPEPMEVETPSERTHKHVTFAPDTKEGSPEGPAESSQDSMR